MITPFYILKLLLFTAVLFATFFGYQRIFQNRLKLLNNLPGGFVIFLAINELIAVPFTFFHGPFRVYFWLFLLANGLAFAVGVKALVKETSTLLPKLKKSLRLSMIPALAVILVCLYLTQAYAWHSTDDAYYVSLVQQSTDSNQLYSYDPATGDPSIPIKTDRIFESWELIEAGISKSLGLSALATTHGLVPILIVLLSFMSSGLVFGLILKNKNNHNFALFFLGLVFLLMGYSVYSQGMFLLTRSWQGKAAIATVIIPLLFYLFLRIWRSPKGIGPYLALATVAIGALALNPVAIFIVGSAIAVYALTFFVLKRDLKTSAKILLSVAPLMLASIVMVAKELAGSGNVAKSSRVIERGDFTWLSSVAAFTKGSWLFILLVLSIPLLWFAKDKFVRNYSKVLIIFSVLYGTLVLNPFLFPILIKFMGTTYWRLFWVIPLTIFLPLAAVVLAETVQSKLRGKDNLIKYLATAGLYAALVCVFIVSGSWILDQSRMNKEATINKLPMPIENTLVFMSGLPPGKVVAPETLAAYYHTLPTKQEILISRQTYFLSNCKPLEGIVCQEKLQLLRASNRGNFGPDLNTDELLNKYDIKYFIMNNIEGGNGPKDYNHIYENRKYVVFERQ